MRIIIITSIVISLCLHAASAQHLLHIRNARGEPASLDDIVSAAQDKQFILFGELHGEPAAHQLELELLQHLQSKFGDKLLLGMEMFENASSSCLNQKIS